MRCDAVRERLPGYLDLELRPVGSLEEHLATCSACRAELSPAPEPSHERLPLLLRQVSSPLHPERVGGSPYGARTRYALASIGGAAVGATALAIVWWRRARRPSEAPARAAV